MQGPTWLPVGLNALGALLLIVLLWSAHDAYFLKVPYVRVSSCIVGCKAWSECACAVLVSASLQNEFKITVVNVTLGQVAFYILNTRANSTGSEDLSHWSYFPVCLILLIQHIVSVWVPLLMSYKIEREENGNRCVAGWEKIPCQGQISPRLIIKIPCHSPGLITSPFLSRSSYSQSEATTEIFVSKSNEDVFTEDTAIFQEFPLVAKFVSNKGELTRADMLSHRRARTAMSVLTARAIPLLAMFLCVVIDLPLSLSSCGRVCGRVSCSSSTRGAQLILHMLEGYSAL